MAIDNTAILAAVAAIIENLFKYPAEDVDAETTAEDVNGWDSLSHTIFLMEVERHFSIKFDPFSVVKMQCIGDLVSEVEQELK